MNEYMDVAIDLSDDNFEKNYGGPFGACIVKDGKIIGKGINRVIKNNDPTAHAEIVAIRNACKNLGIDIMIEDKVTDALNLREVSKVVILSRPYNFGLNNSEIYRASNFKNIYGYIENDKRKIR